MVRVPGINEPSGRGGHLPFAPRHFQKLEISPSWPCPYSLSHDGPLKAIWSELFSTLNPKHQSGRAVVCSISPDATFLHRSDCRVPFRQSSKSCRHDWVLHHYSFLSDIGIPMSPFPVAMIDGDVYVARPISCLISRRHIHPSPIRRFGPRALRSPDPRGAFWKIKPKKNLGKQDLVSQLG